MVLIITPLLLEAGVLGVYLKDRDESVSQRMEDAYGARQSFQ
jgi:hypothetical protein